MNRVLLHLADCRCQRAAEFVAAAAEAAEAIESLIGDDVVEFYLPSLGDVIDGGACRLSFDVHGRHYELDSFSDASEQVAEVLASLSRQFAEAAAALQGGAA